MLYRFIGSEASVAGVAKLERFGQAIELSEPIPKKLPAIPDEQFQEIGFTQEELTKYAYVVSHANAAPEFLEKKKRAIAIYQGGE